MLSVMLTSTIARRPHYHNVYLCKHVGYSSVLANSCQVTKWYYAIYLASHVSTLYGSTHSTCRAHAFRLCRACRTARPDTTSATGV